MKLSFIAILLFLSFNLFSQLPKIPKEWISVEKRTDDLINDLKEQGIDSIFSYFRLRYHYDYYHPKDKTHDHQSTVIVWKNNGIVYFKKINQFYESTAIVRDFSIIFDFYNFNKKEIDTTELRLKPRSRIVYPSDTKELGLHTRRTFTALTDMGAYRMHDRGFQLYYKIGETERTLSWGQADLEPHQNYELDYLSSLSSRLYTLTKILENEIAFIDMNEIWKPLDTHYYSKKEEREMAIDWIKKAEIEIKRLRKIYNANKKATN